MKAASGTAGTAPGDTQLPSTFLPGYIGSGFTEQRPLNYGPLGQAKQKTEPEVLPYRTEPVTEK
jgi:hypothetical protein